MPDFLSLEGLRKRFGALEVTRGVSMSVAPSEILALLGPSGSGKTTVLRLVAGFETPDEGTIRVEGEDVTRLAPEKRRFGMVFQHYALFPHMTVGENVAFGLTAGNAAGLGRTETAERVAETLASVDLSGFEKRRVTALSGGQQQRVALARALAPRPRVLLLDEPLSNLDPTLRERTRRELKRMIRRVGITTLFVTHEQEEAFDLGDRVAVLSRGSLEQVGTPEELYAAPATRFVAGFIGRSSVIPAIWSGAQAPVGGDGTVSLPGGASWRARAGAPLSPNRPVDLLARPEALAFAGPAERDALRGEIAERRYTGQAAFYTVRIEGLGEVEVLASPTAASVGDAVSVVPAMAAPLPTAYPRGEER
jgi:ABC-type Fe3+/spermidine/putrescine transport system ATPase subunit